MATKRCPFCKKKLDEKGRCQNQNCIDYKRTLILEAADQENGENSNESGNNGNP